MVGDLLEDPPVLTDPGGTQAASIPFKIRCTRPSMLVTVPSFSVKAWPGMMTWATASSGDGLKRWKTTSGNEDSHIDSASVGLKPLSGLDSCT